MPELTFLDNASLGKNNWWRYLLTIISTWAGAFILLVLLLVPFFVFSYITAGRSSIENLQNNLNPLYLLIILGAFYIFAFFIFYISSRFIHHKKLVYFINTVSKVNWRRMLKGALIWFIIMWVALILDIIINPGSVKISFNPAFFILLILSLVIYPLQASFEEIFFRGYLLQGLGLITRKPIIPLLLTSITFAIGHFWNSFDATAGMGIVINMFIFGMALGIITLGENGLETAIGVHIANNIFNTAIISTTDVLGNLPSILSVDTGSIGIPPFMMVLVLLSVIFWNKKNQFKNVFKTRDNLVKPVETVKLYCSNCGTANPNNAVYCMECGNKVDI